MGVRVSHTDLPEPDVLVRPNAPPKGGRTSRECDDIIVAFEILSPSTKDRELRWKRSAYPSLPSLTDYVVIAQDAVEVVGSGLSRRFPSAVSNGSKIRWNCRP